MNQNGFSNIAIGVIVAILILGLGGYFVLTQKLKTPLVSSTKTASTSPPLPPVVNNPSGTNCTNPSQSQWLSYKNKDFGFQLNYPPFICQLGERYEISVEFDKTRGSFYLFDAYESFIFSMNIYSASSISVMERSVDEWVKKLAIEPGQIIDLSTLNLNGAEMRRIIFKFPGNTMEAKFFVKIRQYIFESSTTGENTSSPDFFKNDWSWQILSTLTPYE